MSLVTTIPATIEPAAAARVDELRMQRELEQMLDHARQTIPDLRRIAVTLEYPPDYEDDPRVIIESYRSRYDDSHSTIYDQWRDWVLAAFSPDVWRHFVMMQIREP